MLLMLVTACAGAPPPTTRYLLPIDVPEGAVRFDPPVRVGLAPISVAPYLNQPGLVVETETGQIRPASQHVWAEPIALGLYRILQSELSAALGFQIDDDITGRPHWDYAVDVEIDRFHGTLDGRAMLIARWSVTSIVAKGERAGYRFSSSLPLEAPGYQALVDAEIALTRVLAGKIASSIREIAGEAGVDL
jgi:uncharacterized lipoprotein YmbA